MRIVLYQLEMPLEKYVSGVKCILVCFDGWMERNLYHVPIWAEKIQLEWPSQQCSLDCSYKEQRMKSEIVLPLLFFHLKLDWYLFFHKMGISNWYNSVWILSFNSSSTKPLLIYVSKHSRLEKLLLNLEYIPNILPYNLFSRSKWEKSITQLRIFLRRTCGYPLIFSLVHLLLCIK